MFIYFAYIQATITNTDKSMPHKDVALTSLNMTDFKWFGGGGMVWPRSGYKKWPPFLHTTALTEMAMLPNGEFINLDYHRMDISNHKLIIAACLRSTPLSVSIQLHWPLFEFINQAKPLDRTEAHLCVLFIASIIALQVCFQVEQPPKKCTVIWVLRSIHHRTVHSAVNNNW